MDEKGLEFRVGIVVLAAVLVLVCFVLATSDFHWASQYRLYVDFKFSGNISAGAPVKISGVTIGRVASIQFIGAEDRPQNMERLQTRLTLLIDNKHKNALPQGTEFLISTAGVLGEQYLEAVPGDQRGPPLVENSVIRGIDAPRTDLMLARINTVLEAFSHVVSENHTALGDFLTSAGSLSQSLDTMVRKKRDRLESSIDNLADLSGELKSIAHKTNVALGSEDELQKTVERLTALVAMLHQDLPALSDHAKQTLEQAEKTLTALNNDKEYFHKTLVNLETVSDDAKVVTKKLRQKEGTLGLLISDKEIYDDLKDLLADLKKHPWKIIWRR